MKRESPARKMVRASGLAKSIRMRSSFFCNHIWPDSVEVSLTTSVYLMWSMFAVSEWKSRAAASIMPSTESAVHLGGDWADVAGVKGRRAAKIAQKKEPGLLVKERPILCGMTWKTY